MDHYTYLVHSGTKGMKWGERRYQNKDGSLTALGRVHYGVGKARSAAASGVKNAGNAIRKKIRPTEAELDEQIKAQRAKNNKAAALKEKKAELRGLQKDVNYDAKQQKKKEESKGPERTRFSDLTDQDINDRINRLKKEAELANLERMKNMTPKQRMVDEALQGALKTGLGKIAESAGQTIGKEVMSSLLSGNKNSNDNQGDSKPKDKKKGKDKDKDSDKSDDEPKKKKTPQERLEERKAKRALRQDRIDHPGFNGGRLESASSKQGKHFKSGKTFST